MTNDGRWASEEAQAAPPIAKQPDSPGAWAFASVLALIAAYALYGSFDFPIEIRRWPLGLSVVILLCVTIYAVQQAILVRQSGEPEFMHPLAEPPTEYRLYGTVITILATAGFVLFLIGAYLLSFLLATMLFLPAYMVAAGERRPMMLAGVTIGMLLAVWLMFGRLLNAPVETGLWVSLDWLFY
jgi:hypothetical protein